MRPPETSPSPAAAAGDTSLTKRRVARGLDDFNTPQTPLGEMHRAQDNVRPGAANIAGGNLEEEATPDEKAEYDRMMEALSLVLYKNERTSNAVVKMLTPEERVGSIAKASMTLITQLDEKFDFDEVVIPELTQEVVTRIVDLYANVHGKVSKQDHTAALGATWEGVMQVFGVDEEDYAELTAGMSDEEFAGYETQYKEFLGE